MRCDCGAQVARTPHSDWCSTNGVPPKPEWEAAEAQKKWAGNFPSGQPQQPFGPDDLNPAAWQPGDIIEYDPGTSKGKIQYQLPPHGALFNRDIRTLKSWVSRGEHGPPRRIQRAP